MSESLWNQIRKKGLIQTLRERWASPSKKELHGQEILEVILYGQKGLKQYKKEVAIEA